MGTDDRSRRTMLKSAASVAAGSVLIGSAAASKPITVPANYSSIQDAVDAASSGDTIHVKASGGPYREQVIVRKDLTIRGQGNPTLLAPSGRLGVGDIAVIQPIFGAQGYGNDVTIEGFSIDGEEQTDKGGFYSCIGYYLANGELRDVELTGADYGAYISQNRGGGGDQEVTVIDSTFRDLGLESDVNQQLVFNEPGTAGTVKRCTFEGTQGQNYLYGVTAGYGGTVDVQQSEFRDFYDGFGVGVYAFNASDCSIKNNETERVQYPVYVNSSSRSRFTSDGTQIINNEFDGTGLPDDVESYGTTLYAYDTDDEDGAESVENSKVVNNTYEEFDYGVGTYESGEGVVKNTKIIRNTFTDVDEPIVSNGEATKQAANRV